MDLELMQKMGLPTGFGASKKETKPEISKSSFDAFKKTAAISNPPQTQEVQDSEDDIGPFPAPEPVENDEILDHDLQDLPISHQVSLPGEGIEGHYRPITAITLDHGGSRLVTGSRDHTVKLWDFPSMDKRLRYVKSFEPAEGNPIIDLQYGSAGDQLLVATPEHYVRLYDRKGDLRGNFMKGDPYITLFLTFLAMSVIQEEQMVIQLQ